MKTFNVAAWVLIFVMIPFAPAMSARAQWDENGDLEGQAGGGDAEGYGTFEEGSGEQYVAEQPSEDYQGGGVVMEEEEVPEGQGPIAGEVDIDYFFDKLAPYGEWIWTPEYGWVWRPNGVPVEWRPYTYGRWVYTHYGWTWVSYFEWGWAPFHYGNWAYLSPFGWVWVPGTVWAPAWVIWRYSDDYIGWAPMLAGFGIWFGWSFYPVIYDHWTFIHWDHFCHPHPHHHYVPRSSVASIFRHSAYPRGCRNRSGPGCVHGPAAHVVEKRSGSPVKTLRVENLAAKTGPAVGIPRAGLKVSDDSVQIFRPQLAPGKRVRPDLNLRPGRRVQDFGVVPDRHPTPGEAYSPKSPSPPAVGSERFQPKPPLTPRPGTGKSIFSPRPKVDAPRLPAPKAWQPSLDDGRMPTPNTSPLTPHGQHFAPMAPQHHSSPPLIKHGGDRPATSNPPLFKPSAPERPSSSSSSPSKSSGSSHGSSGRHKR